MTYHRAVLAGITLGLALAPAILAAQDGPDARAPGVQADSIVPEVRERAASATVAELLRGRAAGLDVLESSGVVGATPRLWIRGPQSILLRNDPLVVVDGVRVLSDPDALRLEIGGLEVSRLEDLAPDEIQSVRVLRGPAATARYGPEGAAGVLEIRTRGGTPGAAGPRIHAWSSLGVRQEATEFPASYGRPGDLGGGRMTDFCSLQLEEAGFCTPTQPAATSFNPLEANSPFRDGIATTAGVRVGGSAARGIVSYGLSAGTEHAEGVLPNNARDLRHLRGSVSVQRAGARLALTGGHVRRDADLPFGGGRLGDRIGAGLTGPGRETPNGGYDEFLLDEDAYSIGQQAEHTTLGGSLEWTALPWLALGARAGQDEVDAEGEQHLAQSDFRYRVSDRRTRSHWGADATLHAGLPGGARGSLTGGFERLATDLAYQTRMESSNGFTETGTTLAVEQEALFARGTLQWRGVLLGGTVRRDQPASPAGEGAERLSYSVGGEWSVAGASALPAWLNGLTLRAAHGGTERGLESLPWLPDLLAFAAPDCAGCGRDAVERLMETEAGVDVRLLDRVELGLTGYHRQTESENPSLHVGRVTNLGVEARAAVHGGEGAAVEWRLDLSAAANRNRFGGQLGLSAGAFTRHRPGYPTGSYFLRPITGYRDADGDGILPACRASDPCDLVLGDTTEFAGSPLPDHLGSLAGTVRLRGRVTLYARADWQAGAELLDFTSSMRCAVYQNCAVNYDPAAPLEAQAAILAQQRGSAVGFVHGAGFVRLREVAVTLQAPAAWTRRLGGAGVDLTFAGRNLALWTDYPGLDPETSGGASSLFDVADMFAQPPVRSLTTRIDVRF